MQGQNSNKTTTSGQAGGQSSQQKTGRGWHGDPEGHRKAARARKNRGGRQF